MSEAFTADDVELLAAEEPEFAPHGLPPGEWVKANLFNSVLNSIITVVVGIAIIGFNIFAISWIIDQPFEIVRTNLRLFMIGQFPNDELWRPWASGFVVVATIGFVSGALARTSYETAIATDLPAHRATWWELIRRFWAIIAVLIFLTREAGWRAPEALRSRAIFIGATMVVISFLILAGTSRLGGYVLGLIALVWAFTELGRREQLPPAARWGGAVAVGVAVFIVEVLIPHDGFGWEDWGGLHITLFTTVVGITLGMPFGILLALGRRSNLPVIKTASVIFIEFVRGVPLISLLLFSGLFLPLFFPLDFDIPHELTLAIIVIMGFSAAYIAEIVRGGLQAVPNGQTEAAQAMGLSPGAVQRLIVLPQALRAVIPAMVGQFIALFKDTSLLSIIGILEFLRVSDVSNAQPDFVGKGLAGVTYLFVAIGYWAFAYTMSKESRRLEGRLGVGTR